MPARKKTLTENNLETPPEILHVSDGEPNLDNLEVTTRFLREREERLDRQTLRLAQALIRSGFKVTDPRLAILEEISAFSREFEINELVKKVEERPGDKPGIASVFRTVKLLTELGLLQRVHTGDGCHRYGLVRGHNHQMVCRCCDRVVEFQGCDFNELTNFLEQRTGFKLEGHWIEFFGLCPDCRKAAQESAALPGFGIVPLAPHQHSKIEENERPAPLNVSTISQVPS